MRIVAINRPGMKMTKCADCNLIAVAMVLPGDKPICEYHIPNLMEA